MSSSEMLCLVRYFRLIVGELIPIKTEVWELYLSLLQIIAVPEKFNQNVLIYLTIYLLIIGYIYYYLKVL